LPLITGFTTALTIAQEGRGERERKAHTLQTYFFKTVSEKLPTAVINGSQDKRLPNNINISLPEITDPEFAVLTLDHAGIACSTKSSCLKGEEVSYVVASLGGEAWRAQKTLRFTLAPDATKGDVNRIVSALTKNK
jgi:cysteine desulfurase